KTISASSLSAAKRIGVELRAHRRSQEVARRMRGSSNALLGGMRRSLPAERHNIDLRLLRLRSLGSPEEARRHVPPLATLGNNGNGLLVVPSQHAKHRRAALRLKDH